MKTQSPQNPKTHAAIVPFELIDDVSVSITAKGIYALLSGFSDYEGRSTVSMGFLSETAGLQKETVIKYRRELERHGWVINEGQRSQQGFMVNTYKLKT